MAGKKGINSMNVKVMFTGDSDENIRKCFRYIIKKAGIPFTIIEHNNSKIKVAKGSEEN